MEENALSGGMLGIGVWDGVGGETTKFYYPGVNA